MSYSKDDEINPSFVGSLYKSKLKSCASMAVISIMWKIHTWAVRFLKLRMLCYLKCHFFNLSLLHASCSMHKRQHFSICCFPLRKKSEVFRKQASTVVTTSLSGVLSASGIGSDHKMPDQVYMKGALKCHQTWDTLMLPLFVDSCVGKNFCSEE